MRQNLKDMIRTIQCTDEYAERLNNAEGGGIEPSLEIPESFFSFLKSIPDSYIDKTITGTFVKYGLTREDVQLMRTRLESGYYSVEKLSLIHI